MFLLDEIFSSELRSRFALADVFLKLECLVQSKDDLEKRWSCKIPEKRRESGLTWVTWLPVRTWGRLEAGTVLPPSPQHPPKSSLKELLWNFEKYKNLFLQLGRHLSQVEVQDRETSAGDVALRQPIDHQHRPHRTLSLPVPSDCTTKEIYELLHG